MVKLTDEISTLMLMVGHKKGSSRHHLPSTSSHQLNTLGFTFTSPLIWNSLPKQPVPQRCWHWPFIRKLCCRTAHYVRGFVEMCCIKFTFCITLHDIRPVKISSTSPCILLLGELAQPRVKVLYPTGQKIGHVGDAVSSQSLD